MSVFKLLHAGGSAYGAPAAAAQSAGFEGLAMERGFSREPSFEDRTLSIYEGLHGCQASRLRLGSRENGKRLLRRGETTFWKFVLLPPERRKDFCPLHSHERVIPSHDDRADSRCSVITI